MPFSVKSINLRFLIFWYIRDAFVLWSLNKMKVSDIQELDYIFFWNYIYQLH